MDRGDWQATCSQPGLKEEDTTEQLTLITNRSFRVSSQALLEKADIGNKLRLNNP